MKQMNLAFVFSCRATVSQFTVDGDDVGGVCVWGGGRGGGGG